MQRPGAAFTVVEMMVVILVVGLLAILALPAVEKAVARSRATNAARDMRRLGEDFSLLLLQDAGLPAGHYAGGPSASAPAGFSLGDLPRAIHGRPAGWDGALSFDLRSGEAAPNEGAVVLSGADGRALDVKLLRAVDALLDDGDLAAGEARERDGALIYVTHRD